MATWRFGNSPFRTSEELYQQALKIRHISLDKTVETMCLHMHDKLPEFLWPYFDRAVRSLFMEVEHVFTLKRYTPGGDEPESFWRWQIERKFEFYEKPDLSQIEQLIWSSLGYVGEAMPSTKGPLRATAINMVPYARDLIAKLQSMYFDQIDCYRTHRQILVNFAAVNNIDLDDLDKPPKKKLITVHECPFGVRETLDKFLANTVFHELLLLEV